VPKVGIVGLGYVGMQIALATARSGHSVVGFYTSKPLVTLLKGQQTSHAGTGIEEISELFQTGFRLDSSPEVLNDSDVILLCVPTPLDDAAGPNLNYLREATRAVSRHAKRGVLVINESTSYPGTTRNLSEILAPALGPIDEGFFLAFSSERVDPGRESPALTDIPKVVGGVTQMSTEKAFSFYETIFASVFSVSRSEEAEMSKLLENTYRQVNIALVNEMLKFSSEMKIDLWEAIDAASTKPFGFQAFRPGPGVGGHCIPIDPNYLSFHVKKTLGYSFRLVEAAQEINDSMPTYVVRRLVDILNAEGIPLSRASILLIGLGYKEGLADMRGSPSIPIATILSSMGATIFGYDPVVADESFHQIGVERLPSMSSRNQKVDAAILLNGITGVEADEVLRIAHLVLDTRGVFQQDFARKMYRL
jgi:nucleotide sugar dehydrogenase